MPPRARPRTQRCDTLLQDDPSASIRARMETIFDDVQALRNTVNHSSHHARLFDVHRKALRDTAAGQKRFLDLFVAMTSRLFSGKKGEASVDRSIQFVAGYIPYVQTKQADLKQDRRQERNDSDSDSDSDEDDYAPTEHLKEGFIRFITGGFSSKDETVRFRIVQLASQLLVLGLDELDDDIFIAVKKGLSERLEDKKVPVRVQACIGLCKLYPNEQPNEVLNGVSLKQQLLDKLESDVSPDVRRTILSNLTVDKDIIDTMLLRLRDEDTNTRKSIYRHVLPRYINDTTATASGPGFFHPHTLQIAQKERIILDGLGDRDSGVVQEATKLIGEWVDELTGPKAEDGQSTSSAGVVELLKSLDLREEKAASMALKAVFSSKPEVFGGIVFPDTYWVKPTEEEAFLARVYMEYCVAKKEEEMIQVKFPTATGLAIHIQNLYNNLLPESIEEAEIIDVDETEAERERKEEEQYSKEFVFGEMLKLADMFDYGDEQGRRDMSKLTVTMLQQTIPLPDDLNLLCLDMLKRVAFDDRDFVRQVVEIVNELLEEAEPEMDEEVKDEEAEDESFDSIPSSPIRAKPKIPPVLTLQQYARIKTAKIRCLKLVIGLLERFHGKIEDNSSLQGIQTSVIIEAVKDTDADLREMGILALSLCCLLNKRVVPGTLVMFRNEVVGEGTPEYIKVVMLKGIFDMMMLYEGAIMSSVEEAKETIDMLTNLLENPDSSDEIKEITITGLCKLVNARIVTDPKVVMNLLMAFFSPETIDNQAIQQILAFFFHYYSHASEGNQRVLGRVCMPVLNELYKIRGDLEEEQEMHPVQTIVHMFLSWTAPRATKAENEDGLVHFELAQEIARALLGGQIRGEKGKYDFDKEHIKELSQALGNHIQLPESLDELQAYTLHTLISKVDKKKFQDKTVDRLIGKFLKSVNEKYAAQLESMTEEEARKREQLADLFDFVDSIFDDDDDDEEEEDVKPKIGRKRRSNSMSTAGSESDVKPRKRKTKRQRTSTSDNGSDSDNSGIMEVKPPPRRTQPRRKATKKPPVDAEVIAISSDSDEYGPGRAATPVPVKHGKAIARKRREETELDADIDLLLDKVSTPPADSPSPTPPPTIKPPKNNPPLRPRPQADSLFGNSDGSEDEVVNDLLDDESD